MRKVINVLSTKLDRGYFVKDHLKIILQILFSLQAYAWFLRIIQIIFNFFHNICIGLIPGISGFSIQIDFTQILIAE